MALWKAKTRNEKRREMAAELVFLEPKEKTLEEAYRRKAMRCKMEPDMLGYGVVESFAELNVESFGDHQRFFYGNSGNPRLDHPSNILYRLESRVGSTNLSAKCFNSNRFEQGLPTRANATIEVQATCIEQHSFEIHAGFSVSRMLKKWRSCRLSENR
ncbi:hypothetical protein MUK42_27581 [Musa troglodytarum]|uniref:Uncharacterized protein n=1 Tax=Musa troglodytarum TaxID=320322 RepID=A0A9E7FGZ2_9LILI|nr:hypothetical protein MUK42_27581 [Musa troglodytarum]